MLEVDLYPVLEQELAKKGFLVHAEVNGVDVVAKKNDDFLVVELKKTINMKLLHQGLERKKMFEHVYLGIPHPGTKALRSNTFKEKISILKHLGLGLILIHVKQKRIEVLLEPTDFAPRKNYKKKKKLLDEFHGRGRNHNLGGSTGVKVMTSYRLDAIKLRACLEEGPLTLKEIRERTKIERARTILYDNYYDWFERVGRGVYQNKKMK